MMFILRKHPENSKEPLYMSPKANNIGISTMSWSSKKTKQNQIYSSIHIVLVLVVVFLQDGSIGEQHSLLTKALAFKSTPPIFGNTAEATASATPVSRLRVERHLHRATTKRILLNVVGGGPSLRNGFQQEKEVPNSGHTLQEEQQYNSTHWGKNNANDTTTDKNDERAALPQVAAMVNGAAKHLDEAVKQNIQLQSRSNDNHSRKKDIKIATVDLHDLVQSDARKGYYNWKDFLPKKAGPLKIIRWFITGSSTDVQQSYGEMRQNLASLARLLILLREYEDKYGIPQFSGNQEQRDILETITKDLYASGTPTWVLENVMERVAEGLGCKEGVHLMLLPNRAFVYYPASASSENPGTVLFRIANGFNIARLSAVEQVAVRLATFASNTKSVERLDPSSFRMPRKEELLRVEEQESKYLSHQLLDKLDPSEEELANEILNLASNTYGLFFFLNSPKFQAAVEATGADDEFWHVEDTAREVFSRLAAREASRSLKHIHHIEETQQLYPPLAQKLFRIFSAAGACGMWFGGSVSDMTVAALLAMTVDKIGKSNRALAFEERILTEVVASGFVGFCAGLLALKWPDRFCFGAIAVAAVMDLMQGFKVVYAVIEIMSKNIVTGTARLLEGIMFTGLISYSLKFGLDNAFRLNFWNKATPLPSDLTGFLASTHGIPQWSFALLLPLAATAWSGLFRPTYADLPLMAFHGMLAFGLNLAGAPLFVDAMCVTFSAGIISRFTGREALGNTLAGLYALVPGTYMVRGLLSPRKAGFIESVLYSAATIGLGGWTGTILCSPTILGKSSGFHGGSSRKINDKRPRAMLYF